MQFLTPCYVWTHNKQEEKELLSWLREIGYSTSTCSAKEPSFIRCWTSPGKVKEAKAACYDYNKGRKSDVDCGSNIELFRALAAMNDENDLEQWFVTTQRVRVRDIEYGDESLIYEAGKMFFNDVDQKLSRKHFRKATVEEIVTYFETMECKRRIDILEDNRGSGA